MSFQNAGHERVRKPEEEEEEEVLKKLGEGVEDENELKKSRNASLTKRDSKQCRK